ncbi:unnamed protein product [Adineta steineri]|uniref:Uncharacterized protein n=1 Tax=Adineta steineri TaxID=433720 RepID=A0A815DCJ8_9BILA|nr:unnamed protein product [Adineta steineri]CAF3969210.1 unnamed protein product [Adineta steineri]
MAGRLLFAVVFLSFILTILSFQCYEGYGMDCVIDDKNDCGEGAKCVCIKYRYKCSSMDAGCNAEDRAKNAFKWGFTAARKEDCEEMKKPSYGLFNVTCCSTTKCNRPTANQCPMASPK